MSAVDRLLETLKARGLNIKEGNEPGQLILSGPANERTPDVMEALKAFKPQLLERFGWNLKQDAPREPETEAERKRA